MCEVNLHIYFAFMKQIASYNLDHSRGASVEDLCHCNVRQK